MSQYNGSKSVDIAALEWFKLLATRLCDLPLKIPGSHLENSLNRLYAELERSGIGFKPAVYLSDGWGCPDAVPIIGIPFYLADWHVYQAVNVFFDPAPFEETEIIRYLRHETGHALNYAYLLHQEPEWEQTFGSYAKPYQDNYRAIPFDPRFIRHAAGWYAQKHPDEDFAETFAVWLDPDSGWREIYTNTPVMPKLRYIEAAVKAFGKIPPLVSGGALDRPLNTLDINLAGWSRRMKKTGRLKIDLPAIIDEDLKRLFPESEGYPASRIINAHRRPLVRAVHDWTGVSIDLVNSLIAVLTQRVKMRRLKVGIENRDDQLLKLTAFVTTLAMNYQYTSEFIKGK
jgi:hypothetical protein